MQRCRNFKCAEDYQGGHVKQRKREQVAKSAATSLAPWTLGSIALAAVAVIYAIAFYSVTLESTNIPRAEFWRWLLLPDDVVKQWLGEGGSFALADRIPIFLGVVAVHLVAWAMGFLTLRPFRISALTQLERLIVTHGAGLSILSLATLLLGLAGGLHQRGLVAGAATVAMITALVVCRRDRLPTAELRAEKTSDDWLSPRWCWLAMPIAMFLLLGGLLPPVDFDVREYHLQAPKEFFELGRVTFLPHNVYANMPLGAEMWPLSAMVATGDWWMGALIGKAVIATLAPLTALALFVAGSRLGSRTAGIVAALFYLSFPWILHVSSLGLIDAVPAYYASLVLLLLLPRGDADVLDVRTAALAAFLAGSASACKYPALLFIAFPTVAFIAWASRSLAMAGVARRVAVAGLAIALACGPWFAKNGYFTGNPTYPLLYSLFDGATRTAENATQWNAAHRPPGFAASQLLGDGVRLAITSPWLSPVALPFVGAALIVTLRRWPKLSRSHRATFAILVGDITFTLVCWWCFTHRIDRFWLPIVPAACLLAGLGAATWQDRLGRATFIGALSLSAAWSLLLLAVPGMAYERYFAPLAELRNSPERVDPWLLELNERGGRALVIGEAAVFDLENQPLYNTTFDPSWLARYGVEKALDEKSLAGFDQLVADHDLKYVYVDWDEVNRYRAPGNYGFDPRVTPELFEKLIAAGRLERPFPKKEKHNGEVYRVKFEPLSR